jgi:MOSC domain
MPSSAVDVRPQYFPWRSYGFSFEADCIELITYRNGFDAQLSRSSHGNTATKGHEMKRLAEENLHKRATAFGMPIRSRLVTPNKSVYAYAIDDVRWWEDKLGRSLEYGEFGERWAIGTGVFEVSEPQIPCWRLGVRMNDQLFPRRFTEALRLGTYLRIIVEDAVGAGDEIKIIERPAHDRTVRDIFRIYTRDREEVERLLAVPRISESRGGWAQHFLEETKGRRARSAPPGCC